MKNNLQVVQTDKVFAKVSLIETSGSGYILLSAEMDRRSPLFPMSSAKRTLLKDCKRFCEALVRREEVKSAVTFKALLIPPGRGKFLNQRPDVHIARFDVVVLIETSDLANAQALRDENMVTEFETQMRKTARYMSVITAVNVKQIRPVGHKRKGVFLFNYFYADDADQNLAVWEYTAGWFQQETGLDNSIVLLPEADGKLDYPIINHCRWDHLRDILPSILFKPSFRSYVLANFEANNTAAMPILYSLA